MSPRPRVFGVRELARRWGVSRVTATSTAARDGFPEPATLHLGRVWDEDDVVAWEDAERAAGRALPGETGYGPLPGTGGRPKRKPGHGDTPTQDD